MQQQVELIDIDKIIANAYQPREEEQFDIDELNELAETIKSVGLIHPPTVCKKEGDQYELVAGERRLRAAKIAGLKQIPVIVRDSNQRQSALAAIIENLQRVDLNPLELAKAYQRLIDDFDMTHQELANSLGLNRASLSNQIRILQLPKMIQSAVSKNKISLGHAKVLAGLENETEKMAIFQMILRDNLSVRQTEQKIERQKKDQKNIKKDLKRSANIFLQQIKEDLQKQFGTKVDFIGDESKGVIQLHYYSLSDLNRLLEEVGYDRID